MVDPRFFDSIEQNDYETLEKCYAPEAIAWHSHDCRYQSLAGQPPMLKQGMKTLPTVRIKDRRIHVFEAKFVEQHTIYVTRANGFVGQMDVCFVGYVRDGMISRAYEYFDTGQIDKFVGPEGIEPSTTEPERYCAVPLSVSQVNPSRSTVARTSRFRTGCSVIARA
jgi:ketosteroid isomerase-like protein